MDQNQKIVLYLNPNNILGFGSIDDQIVISGISASSVVILREATVDEESFLKD